MRADEVAAQADQRIEQAAPAERRPVRRFARSALPWVARMREGDPGDEREIDEGERTASALRRDSLVRRALAIADLAAATLALGAASAVEGHVLTLSALAVTPLVVVFSKLGRLYDRDEHVVRKSTLDQAPQLLHIATLFTLIAWLASDEFVRGGFGKSAVAVLWATLLVSLFAFRYLARRGVVRATSPERILVLGNARDTRRLAKRIETAHSLHAQLVGRVAFDTRDREEPQPLGTLPDLDYVLRARAIDRVVIVPHEESGDDILETVRTVKSLGVKASVLPRLFEVVGSSMEFDDIDGILVVGLRRYGLPRTSWYVKRAFDVVVASVALLLLAPLLTTIAVAVRLSSPGPVLFRQPRVGRQGKRFEMLKFRTMYDGADAFKAELLALNDADGLFKIADDPRVTRVGRLLRNTSMDELPQLLNVLRGQMSLVGPRPLVEEEDRKIAGSLRRREATPGMTGVWQMLGPTRVSLNEMVKLDYLYRANWSLWLDVKILLRTLGHVCSRRGI
jgi:exopolysaccharide biosynthesis polyprenyl glycosylphosphotransferase